MNLGEGGEARGGDLVVHIRCLASSKSGYACLSEYHKP